MSYSRFVPGPALDAALDAAEARRAAEDAAARHNYREPYRAAFDAAIRREHAAWDHARYAAIETFAALDEADAVRRVIR